MLSRNTLSGRKVGNQPEKKEGLDTEVGSRGRMYNHYCIE
jgi:hypothetical protein